MKIKVFAILIFLGGLNLKAQEYQLVWEDNFDGNRLDSSVWNVEERVGIWNTGQNAELQHYLTENISVGDDGNGNNCLIIKTDRESYNGFSFTSGRVNTNSKFSFQFGKLEARIKIPDLENGLWPAYWTEGYSSLPWPDKGEIDILEMGFSDGIAQDTVNSYVASATHWEFADSRADYGTHIVASENLSQDYHLYTLIWTPTSIKTYLDETRLIFSFSLTGNDLEEYKEIPNFILFNMAVGGILPGITNPAQITAPMPAEMFVDYVKLYQLEGQEDYTLGSHVLEGPVGFYSEGDVSVNMNPKFDSEIVVSGLDISSSTAYEGYQSLAYNTRISEDFSLEINSLVPRNFSAYNEGALNFVLKTDYQGDIVLTVADFDGQTVSLTLDDSKTYNPGRDNNWSQISIPIADFEGSIDLSKIKTGFKMQATGIDEVYNLELDKVIWNESYSGPVNTTFYGIFADHEDIDTKLDFGTVGNIYVWNGFTGVTRAPYYGDGVLGFNANPGTWNGFGIHSDVPVDLSAFEDAYMNFAIKTTSNEEFTFGFKNQADQSWEKTFAAGTETSQFERDGEYHIISIKLKSFTPMDGAPAISSESLKDITIPFYLLGKINFSIDEIYLTKDGSRPGYSTIRINELLEKDSKISIYPVPAENTLFSRGIDREAQISIYSFDGSLKEQFIISTDLEMDIADYQPGLYLIRIQSGKEILNKYFIKK